MTTLAKADPQPLVRRLVSERIADCTLVAWYFGWFVVSAWSGGASWHFFVQGQQALGDLDDSVSGGWHLYAALPQLQIGPVALFGAWLLSPFGSSVSLALVEVLAAGAGLAILVLIGRIAHEFRPELDPVGLAWRIRVAAVFFTPVWMNLAVASGHLDDVLAMLCAVSAVYAALRQRPGVAGLLLGLAVDSKPWAVPFAAVLLLITGKLARAKGFAVLTVTVAAAWLPFLLLDPHTINAFRFTIPNTPRSALRVLGITDPRTPRWDRPTQFALGLLLSVLAIRRGRWPAVLMVAIVTRMVLDPGTNVYYAGGLVVATALWDIAGSGLATPWWTAAAALSLYLGRYVGLPPSTNGWFLIAFFGAALALLALNPQRQ